MNVPAVVAPAESLGVMETSGGLYTSLNDLARYLSFQLAAWPPRDDPETGPLKRSSVREMQQGMRTASAVSRSRLGHDPLVRARGVPALRPDLPGFVV